MIQLERKQQLALLVIIGIILFGAGFKYAQFKGQSETSGPPVLDKQARQADIKPKEIVVHVLGAVDNPGVYRFPDGARNIDAVEKAKASSEADLNAINLAAPLVDGTPVMVPFKGGAENVSVSTPPTSAAGVVPGTTGNVSGSGKININTAGANELDSLPGIGPTLAERIIQYRQANGPFRSIEDLKNVSGIGDKKFEDLKSSITI